MHRARARIILLAVLAVVAAAIVAARVGYGMWAARCQAEFDAVIGEIRARGEPVWFSELEPHDHPEWDEAGRRLDEILSRLQPLSEEFDRAYHGVGPPEPENYSALAAAVVDNREVIDEVVDLARTTVCRHPYDYHIVDPVHLLMNHVSGVRTVAKLLTVDGNLCVIAGDQAGAWNVVTSSLQLPLVLGHEPLFVPRMVLYGTTALALDSLEHYLTSFALIDEQFSELDRALQDLEAYCNLSQTTLEDRCAGLTAINAFYDNPRLFYRAASFRDAAYFAQQMEILATLVDRRGPAARRDLARFETDVQSTCESTPATHRASALLIPKATVLYQRAAEYRQRLASTRLVLRALRYRNLQGALPASLSDALLGEHDPPVTGVASGTPVVYEADAEHVRVYDVHPDAPEEPIGVFSVEF
ncbi:MAG: hypothetical protein AB7U73_01725 [Pirellulales bacterium]